MNKHRSSIAKTSSKDPSKPERDENEEIWLRLHDEAQSRLDEVSSNRRKFAVWGIVLLIAMIVLGASGFGIYQNLALSRGFAHQATATSNAVGIITAQYNSTVAANRLATDAAVFTEQSQIWSTKQFATATYLSVKATSVALSLIQTQPATPESGTQPLSSDCRDASSFSVEVISGPKLTPSPGTRYIIGSQTPVVQVSWVIKNTGKCDWARFGLWSQNKQMLASPVVRQNGLIVTPEVGGSKALLASGDQMEITLVFKAADAQNVNDEWVFVVNGLSLSDQPHLVLNQNNWVIGILGTPTPTTMYRARPTHYVPPPRPSVTP
jgi:hypothetical protein